MPNEIGPHLEQWIIAFSLGHPGFGPRRISAELAREKWGGLRISEHGIWRVLCRVGLNTRGNRLALIARYRDPYVRAPSPPPPERHIDASEPGEIVQMDCFLIGRLSSSKGSGCTPHSATPDRAIARRSFTASATSSRSPAGSSRP